jgi:pimeloyl-ACP methyl ester carboxylesterase
MNKATLRTWMVRIAAGVGILVVSLITAGFLYETVASQMADKRYPAPGTMIDVGGHRLHLHCLGEGRPTVILDAGAGPLGSLSWKNIHVDLALDTQVCAYDRAGILWSERSPEARPGENAIADFSALLNGAGEAGPVVLVGHSLGGQFAVEFATLYPERVAGLVLVDASHPAMLERLPAEIRTAFVPPRALRTAARVAARLGIVRLLGADLAAPHLTPAEEEALSAFLPRSTIANLDEIEEAVLSNMFVPRAGALGARPVVLLSAGRFGPGEPPGWSVEWSITYMQVWDEMQDSIAVISTASRRLIAEESDHMIHWNEPELVTEAVRNVVADVRAAELP